MTGHDWFHLAAYFCMGWVTMDILNLIFKGHK